MSLLLTKVTFHYIYESKQTFCICFSVTTSAHHTELFFKVALAFCLGLFQRRKIWEICLNKIVRKER